MIARLKTRAWALGAAFLFALLVALPVLAADAPAVQRTTGKITAVSATSISIQPRTGDAKTFTITAATTVRIDGKAAAIGDLKKDMRVRVNNDGTNALEISNRVRKPAAPPAAEAPAPPLAPAAPAPATP